MDQKLLEKVYEARKKWLEAAPETKKEKECVDLWEGYCSQLLAGAKTEKELETVYRFSPSRGLTKSEARERLDDLNIQIAKNQLELFQVIKEYNKTVDDDKKAALAKLEETCLRIIDEAMSPSQVKLVSSLFCKCRPEVSAKAMDKMAKFLIEALE